MRPKRLVLRVVAANTYSEQNVMELLGFPPPFRSTPTGLVSIQSSIACYARNDQAQALTLDHLGPMS